MDPVTMMLIAQAGAGAYQLIKGQMQLANTERPTYEIPDEIKANLTQAQMQALEGLPEEQRKLYVENIQRSKQNAVSGLQDRRSGLAGLVGLQQSENDAYRNLLAMDVQARQANQAKLTQANQEMAQYKNQEFETNQMEPYRFKTNQANALVGAGMQNLMGAGQGAVQNQFNNDYLNSIVPKQAPQEQMQSQPVGQMPYSDQYKDMQGIQYPPGYIEGRLQNEGIFYDPSRNEVTFPR